MGLSNFPAFQKSNSGFVLISDLSRTDQLRPFVCPLCFYSLSQRPRVVGVFLHFYARGDASASIAACSDGQCVHFGPGVARTCADALQAWPGTVSNLGPTGMVRRFWVWGESTAVVRIRPYDFHE